MRPSEIENWTLKVIEQLKAGQRIEETRVEVKTIWIDHQEAARIIAGQANAARGEPILWIIGVDEKNPNAVGVKKEELAVWWESVRSEFDGVYPSMTDINVPVDGTTVVSLLFETDRAPFVVKNPNFGKVKDKIKFDVPWREGTSTRTASRSDLLRLLVPVTHKPEIEVLGGELTCSKYRDKENLLHWNLVALKLYIEPVTGSEINFVFHRCKVSFQVIDVTERIELLNIRMKPPFVPDLNAPRISSSPFHTPMKPDSVTAAHTESEMMFQGPGRGDLTGSVDTSTVNHLFDNTVVNINVKLSYSREEQPVVIQTRLRWRNPTEDKERILSRWVI